MESDKLMTFNDYVGHLVKISLREDGTLDEQLFAKNVIEECAIVANEADFYITDMRPMSDIIMTHFKLRPKVFLNDSIFDINIK